MSAAGDTASTAPETPAPRGPAAASVFAVELLGELIRRGVRDVVVCPGSRSQALALAAAAAERADAIRLHVRIDERSAGFFALGVARETGMPAPIIVTSGTAVANLAPAVFEAHESRVPLLLLTADRPTELRGIRSNQTTRQAGLFRSVARLSLDVPPPEFGPRGDLDRGREVAPGISAAPGDLASAALAASLPGATPAGPVQVNLAFREPLSGMAGFETMIERGFAAAAAEAADTNHAARVAAALAPQPDALAASDIYVQRADALTVVIAGEGSGEAAAQCALDASAPLLAEVVSGVRSGREAIAHYAELIDDPEIGGQIERAIVFGHPTLTRQVPALLKRADVEVIVVDPHAGAGVEHYAPAPDARVVRAVHVEKPGDTEPLRRWLGLWVVADRALQHWASTVHEPDLEAASASGYQERNAYARAELAAMRAPVTRELLAESVWRATWPHDRLVVAASRLVRVLDRIAPARHIAVHANRGLAGIDGTVATALGIAATSQAESPTEGQGPESERVTSRAHSAGTTRVLIGDLALLHDAGSLSITAGESRPRIQLFVGNDGGGTIFDGLEVAGSADERDFARVMRTPQRVDLARLAAAYGWEHRLIETRVELERLLTEPVTGPMLVEVPLA